MLTDFQNSFTVIYLFIYYAQGSIKQHTAVNMQWNSH